MINAEKYLKDSVAITDFIIAFRKWYYGEERIIRTADKDIENFLREKAKPTLTDDERVILRNIDEHYRYISREKGGDIRFSFANESFRRSVGCDSGLLFVYNHLFQFIKEGEEYSIEELLK